MTKTKPYKASWLAPCLYKNIFREQIYLFSLGLFSNSRHLKVHFRHFLSSQQPSKEAEKGKQLQTKSTTLFVSSQGQTRYLNAHPLCTKAGFIRWLFVLYLSIFIGSCRFTRSWPVGYICEFAALKYNRYNTWVNVTRRFSTEPHCTLPYTP